MAKKNAVIVVSNKHTLDLQIYKPSLSGDKGNRETDNKNVCYSKTELYEVVKNSDNISIIQHAGIETDRKDWTKKLANEIFDQLNQEVEDEK
jgi:hypothetical protein